MKDSETMQKILHMTTSRPSLRAKADSWSAEDSNLVEFGKPIGMTHDMKEFHCYDCPLRAVACGWKLLAPPVEDKYEDGNLFYNWWFVKE
jgi:hypothetical protein